jgi:hypothetical protein
MASRAGALPPGPEGVRISAKTSDGGVYFHSGERPSSSSRAASEQLGENSLEKCAQGTFRRRFRRERHRGGAVNKRGKNQMEERERKNRTPPKHAERRERERPHRPRKRGPVPAGFGVTPASCCRQSQHVFWPREESSSDRLHAAVHAACRQVRVLKGGRSLPILKVPPKNQRLQVCKFASRKRFDNNSTTMPNSSTHHHRTS